VDESFELFFFNSGNKQNRTNAHENVTSLEVKMSDKEIHILTEKIVLYITTTKFQN